MDFGNLGLGEVAFILVLALVVFGPRRLPEIGHAVGRMTARLRRATNEFRHAWESELDDESRESLRDASRQLRQVRDDVTQAGRQAWSGGSESVASARAAWAEAQAKLEAGPRPAAPPQPSPPEEPRDGG